MNKPQNDFIILLRNALTQENNPIKNIDYEKIEKIAVNHLCLPLVCAGLLRCSTNVPELWKKHSIYVAANNYNNLSVQNKVLKILYENNIRCAVLKGITVSRCYPEPLYRPLGDIDILVDIEHYDKAIKILTGTTQMDSEQLKHKFHYHFLYEGISIEIHKSITKYTNDEQGNKIQKYLEKALVNTKNEKYECFSFPMFSDEFQIISLVLHIQRHFVEHKSTMRMVCDVAMAVQSINNDVWNDRVYSVLCELELETFTCAIMELSSNYLGINFEGKAKKSINKKVIEELLLEFLYDGVSPMYYDIQNSNCEKMLASIFATIKEIIKRDFKIVKKVPVLYPIFFIYVPLRSLVRKALGKRKNVTITGYGASFNRRSSLCEKLNV